MMIYAYWNWLCILIFYIKINAIQCPVVIVETIDEDVTIVKKPIWNIAHMVNALYQIDHYLNKGANSLEFDVAFDSEGVARFTFHGFPCDCFRTCLRYENFATYLDYLRQVSSPGDPKFREELVLLFMDFKINGLSPGALVNAGADVARKLINHYWTTGGRAYIVLCLPSVTQIAVIHSFMRTLEAENMAEHIPKIGFDFSGNEDLDLIRSVLEQNGINDKIWVSDGITNCLPRGVGRLVDAIGRRDQPGITYVNKVYWWTVDRESTMRRILSLGVDGMITNKPRRLINVLNEEPYSSYFRLATIEDSPWEKFPKQTGSLIIMQPEIGNLTEEEYYAAPEEEEMLYNT